MYETMLFLHVIGATGAGFYLLLPFLLQRTAKLDGSGQAGLAAGLVTGNRIAQYVLILQFITGGYMISKADYTVLWMVLVIVLFLAIIALAGIVTKPLKRLAAALQGGGSSAADVRKARTLSLIVFVLFLINLYFMKFPIYES